ncbi:acyl-CoA dehydrogenase family protein [Actinophytocola sp.]|uniref:acyl-CoA dehydrogenase family protein n=1 Tax=Actinophytocola sp. TaxID=1872138 RepID=UPI003D6A26B1
MLTAAQQELRDATREFTEREVVPIAAVMDREDGQIPAELLEKMARIGYFGVNISEEYSGLGLDTVSLCVITEELCRGSLSVGSVIHRNATCGKILELAGTETQRQRWLADIATGRIQTASAGTEPQAGSDAGNIQTRARRNGDNYVITGAKQWCTFANRADALFTYARTSDASKHGGISLFVVEKKPGDDFAPPELTGTRIPTVGYHGMYSYSLHFDGLEVSADNLVGGVEGQGFRQLMGGYEVARTTFAARCVGVAQAAYEAALRYATDRVQFGKPIKEFQAVRFRLADMATQIRAARALTLDAARMVDGAHRADVQAGMAKLFASEMAQQVCWSALYIHGGNGYAVDSDVNRYWRDAALLPIGEGTSDIQREVIARGIVDRRVEWS